MHEQCEDRTYRIGQHKKVFVQYLVASRPGGTLDEAVMQLGDKKRDDSATLLGGRGTRGQRSMASLFSALSGRDASRPPTGAADGAPSGSAETGAGAPGSSASSSDSAQGAGPYQAPPPPPPPPPKWVRELEVIDLT